MLLPGFPGNGLCNHPLRPDQDRGLIVAQELQFLTRRLDELIPRHGLFSLIIVVKYLRHRVGKRAVRSYGVAIFVRELVLPTRFKQHGKVWPKMSKRLSRRIVGLVR